MVITLSDEATKQSIASIRRYFEEELEQDIGDLKAGNVLSTCIVARLRFAPDRYR